jgi:chorismate mutase
MKGELVIVVILASNGTGMARAQNGRDELQPLVATSARRLAVAEQVALAKWDSGAAVDDAKREAQVIIAAVKYGESKGLGQTFITNFFTAQIEANKFIQYSLLARLASRRESTCAYCDQSSHHPRAIGPAAD